MDAGTTVLLAGLLTLLAGIVLIVIGRKSSAPDAELKELREKLDSITQNMNSQLQEQTGRLAESIAKVREASASSIADSFTKTQKELSESLSQGRAELTKSMTASQSIVSEKLEKLIKESEGISNASRDMLEIGKDIRQLSDILDGGQTRGAVGEFQLSLLLKNIIPAGRYKEQHKVGDGIVDAAIILKDRILCIDSKFPLANLLKSGEAQGEESKKFLKEFYSDVKARAKEIKKKYIVPEKTLEFAIMFIPSESVFHEIIANNELHQNILDMNVVPASPNFLYVYFQALAIGFRGLAIEEEAEDILKVISTLKIDFDKFNESFKLVGTHIDRAVKQYNESQKQAGRLDVTLSNLRMGKTLKGGKGGSD